MPTKRAAQPAAMLGALAAVCLLRCSGAFFAHSTEAGKGALPGNKPTRRGSSVALEVVVPDAERSRSTALSAFGGVSLEWDGAADGTALFGEAVGWASSSLVAGGRSSDADGEQKERGVMTSALAQRGADGGGATTIEASGAGGTAAGGGGRWGKGLRKVRSAVGRVLQRGDSAGGGGGEGDQQQVEEEVAVTSAAVASSLGSQELLTGGSMVPPVIAALDTVAVELWSNVMPRDMPQDNSLGCSRRVLILMSDTGGGHRASAEALAAAFDALFPGMVDVEIVDIWTHHAPPPLNNFVGAYQFMAEHPLLWKALWEYGRFPPTRILSKVFMNIRCHKRFKAMFEAYKPDLVLSVHPLCQEVPLRVLKMMGGGTRQIPFVTVVTDLGGAHPTWFHRDVDACFVPSERLAILAHKCGLAPDKVRLHGLPIRAGFWREQSAKTELQAKLGLKPEVKTCLVVGGGDGVGRLEAIARSVGRRLGQDEEESQVVVVCGKNAVVKASLESASWAPNVNMHVKGSVSNMDEWMGAVDCIVTKAGPGTIAEATTRGLPIMLSAFLPGQEEGNVPYVVEGGFGSFSKNPSEIADTISKWFRDDELLARMSSKAKQASRPMATFEICEDIGRMLFSWKDFVLEKPGRCTQVFDASIME